ncbi:hypothetical protein IAG41_05940 [Sphingomonas sp. JC676]|uniref:hypothetical protein n=1 Tax=Sphingomonas sp. JC676 TaxID=2768065 RepID=UPI0016583894|nr:hypothetical protein [Sphingomonas sp. JC676]MBC9031927.1 hypothetical protein [Sphingomonas sp. JC676]
MSRSRSRFLALALFALPLPAMAQTGGTAHLYAYTLSDRPSFEKGYRKHLEWHAARGDKLAWFAWYVMAGDRAGAFVDGTFGTTPQGLANRPDPEGDGADFRANAAPFAKALGDEGWELWRQASTATPLEERQSAPLIQVHAIAVSDPARFEAALVARPIPNASWYRAIGDGPAAYLLVTPATSVDVRPDLAGLLQRGHPALALAHAVRSETWRYAPRLALMPGGTLAP